MTAKDFHCEILELHDFYGHGRITRREFPGRAGKFAVGGLTAMAILGMTSPDHARARQVAFTTPGIVAEHVTYPSPVGHGEVRGYLVRRVAAGVPYEAHVYPGTNHGFHNDSTPRHDGAAARLAWDRTVAHFRAHLG